MPLRVGLMVCEDAVGIRPEDGTSLQEAGKMPGMKPWRVHQLVDRGELTLLIDADAPEGWAWRWLLLPSEG